MGEFMTQDLQQPKLTNKSSLIKNLSRIFEIPIELEHPFLQVGPMMTGYTSTRPVAKRKEEK